MPKRTHAATRLTNRFRSLPLVCARHFAVSLPFDSPPQPAINFHVPAATHHHLVRTCRNLRFQTDVGWKPTSAVHACTHAAGIDIKEIPQIMADGTKCIGMFTTEGRRVRPSPNTHGYQLPPLLRMVGSPTLHQHAITGSIARGRPSDGWLAHSSPARYRRQQYAWPLSHTNSVVLHGALVRSSGYKISAVVCRKRVCVVRVDMRDESGHASCHPYERMCCLLHHGTRNVEMWDGVRRMTPCTCKHA
jgi:hypothetical protein